MDETTTTGGADATAAVDTTQAADVSNTTAAQANETTTATTTDKPETSADDASQDDSSDAGVDDNLKWLQAKGIDPSDPEAVAKLAEMARNSEKKMHESTAKVSELEKSITDGANTAREAIGEDANGVEARIKRIEMANAVINFFNNDAVDATMRPVMAKIAKDNPNIAYMVEGGFMSLGDLYNMAVGQSAKDKISEAKTQGGKEALTKLADKQSARAVRGNATSSTVASADKERDAFLAGFNSKD